MIKYNRLKLSVVGATVTAATAASSLFAGDYGKTIVNDKVPIESWTLCDIFNHTTLYKGDGFVKSIKFTGRYHGNFIDTEDNHVGGGESEAWDHRRFRAGFVAKLGNNLTFQNIYNLNTSPVYAGQFVDNVDELFLQWDPSEDLYITVGKQKQKILSEYRNSSNALLVHERSILTQQFISQKLYGVAVGFKALGLSHEVGVWSTDLTPGFAWAQNDNGASLTYRTNYELDESTKLFFDYQYVDQTRDVPATFAAAPFENVFAVGSESKWGNFGVNTDLIYGTNRQDRPNFRGQDAYGFQVTPYYDVTDKLQLVARYAYLSEGRIGRPQQFASRPEVEDLGTFYLGANYAICKTKLRLQGGYEWSSGNRLGGADYDNGTWLVGVRTHW